MVTEEEWPEMSSAYYWVDTRILVKTTGERPEAKVWYELVNADFVNFVIDDVREREE